MAPAVVVQKLDFHFRHVDAGRAFALATLATHAQIHRLAHRVRGESVCAQLAGQGEPQRIGAAAGEIALVAGGAIRRAHGAGVELAAMSVVVAHLDCGSQAQTGCCAGSRDCGCSPFAPIQGSIKFLRRIPGFEAEQAAVVLLCAAHYLARIHQIARVEQVLDFLQGAREPRADDGFYPLGAYQTVAVFARVGGAFVAPHQLARLFGDGAHLPGAVFPHVQHRTHVQSADRRVRIPGAARAVLGEHLGQLVGVFGKVLQRHRAVLDEGNRLAVAFHRHHDVETRLSHLPHVLLQRGVGDFDHTTGKSEVGHELHQLRQPGELL